ncbi:hypothetical protein LMG33818_002005 [Halomonadaceae bacterium LMG 33818]|uniref:hypothetical protein n=1 Tax=Cernens ardua TaxID=3402176 RepID=UPI003EDBF92D
MIEGIGICIAVLVIQLVVLYFIDKRLDYAQMNHSYAADWGAAKRKDIPGESAAKVSRSAKKRKAAIAANEPANDELP